MTRRRPAYEPTPRVLKKHGTAALLGWGDTTFDKKRPALEAEGFPLYDELLGGWDAHAIEHWLDQRSGFAAQNTGHDPLMEALNDHQA